ncbi:hypothetical protein [Methylorubrum sp. SB2]|uniref:hypothetical protein n=1 Tax=Methylorubrum subtropicum TaxID=3138812 RepID=UPI00313DFF38
MAEIHVFPLPFATGRDATSVTALIRAIECGVDLGTREHHIKALRVSLENTSQLLQQAAATLPPGLEARAAEWERVRADIAELTRMIERLTALCQSYPM